MSDKIKSNHLERKAILYVRQSSVYQVQNNLESQKLQYAMRDRLCKLGWRDIEVIDEDLGRSASGTVTRAGFERMVAEACLGHVGGSGQRGVALCTQQSGMAEGDRSLSSSGDATNRSSLWFRSIEAALRTTAGYEGMNVIRKGQIRWLAKGDILGQVHYIERTVGVVA